MVKGTTHIKNTAAYFAERRWPYQPLVIDSLPEAAKAFYAGRCEAFASDASELAALRLNAPYGADGYRILPGRISKEPLGPVVRQGDDDWTSIVRWVLFLLITAEEHGVTRDNVRTRVGTDDESAIARVVADSAVTAKALGIRPDWAVKVIETVGNYGELFERTIGKKGALGLDREYNRNWRNGGLLYAPPLR
jgi:general L-amino acid transport system substrate-binding protein